MKKIIIALSAALLSLAACTQFENETAPDFSADVKAPSLVCEAPTTMNSDSAFVVTVTPGKGNVYYSYAIIKGTETALDPETLLEDGYSKKAVAVKLIQDGVEVEVPLSGCFNASEQADTTVVAFDLVPNSAYTVYAVGVDNLGKVSKVTASTITTTDKLAPVVNDKKTDASGLDDDGEISFQFDDPVVLTDAFKAGTAKFHVSYAGINNLTPMAGNKYILPIYTKDVDVDSVAVSGAKVTIKVPDRVPGAIVFVTFDAGVVENGVKTANAAFTTAMGAPKANGGYEAVGIYGRFSTEEFEISLPTIKDAENKDVRMPKDTVLYFNDWTTLEMSVVAPELVNVPYNGIVPTAYPEVKYTNAANRKVIYDSEDIAVANDSTLVIKLTEDPGYGTSVAFTIAAGSIEDIYGNTCEELSTSFLDADDELFPGNYFCSYGYTLADVLGTYTFAGTSKYAGPQTDSKVVIAPSDDEDYDVMIYDLFHETTCLNDLTSYTPDPFTKFYATVDFDSGIMVVYGDAIGEGVYNSADYYIVAFGEGEEGEFTCSIPASGKIVLNSTVYMLLYGLGSWDSISAGTLTRTDTAYDYTEPTPDPAPAPAPAKRAAKKVGNKNLKSLR
jgi:hypothetical protein